MISVYAIIAAEKGAYIMSRAVSVGASTTFVRKGRPGSSPRTALHLLRVCPLPINIAKALLVREHYLHSLPGGTCLAFGTFICNRLLGALTFGVGPTNAHRLVEGATRQDCLTLTRLWLSDELPGNSESRTLGVAVRSLRKHTAVKFVISYADPSQGHVGTIYQASNWLYTGLSQATPLYDIGDGIVRHSRSLSHAYGSHSVKHFASHGVEVKKVPQVAKHRYVYFLDSSIRHRLNVPVLPCPKKAGAPDGPR